MKPCVINSPTTHPEKPPISISICMEHEHNHLSDLQASLYEPKPNLNKRRKRFESIKKLLATNNMPDQVVSQKSDKPRSGKRKSRISHDLYGKTKVTSSVMERAQAVQANLNAKFPSFIKPMIRSNVTRGFWLSLPNLFCKLHLPSHDSTITLIDESQRVHDTRYLIERNGLSAGWRGFSIAHNLVEGDVLVFHLVGVCRMKVYIVRANHLGEVDAALSLLHLDARARQMDHEQPSQDNKCFKESTEKCLSPCLEEIPSEELVVNENVHEDLSLALEGLITETLSIADVVKASKIIISPKDFSGWKKRSICFEHLHDSLGWISARLDYLVFRILESNEAESRRRGRGAGCKWDHGKEMRAFKVKMLELKEATERLNAEIEVLKINAEMHNIAKGKTFVPVNDERMTCN